MGTNILTEWRDGGQSDCAPPKVAPSLPLTRLDPAAGSEDDRMKRRLRWLIPIVVLAVVAVYVVTAWRPRRLLLTGIVTTDEVIVSSEIQGRLQKLLVRQGDTVTPDQLLAVIRPEEWKAGAAFFENSARQSASQVTGAEADLRFEVAQADSQIKQAEANLAAATAQVAQGEADLENARLTFERETELNKKGVESTQAFDLARTACDSAKARAESLHKQAEAAQAAVALARANAEQVAVREAAVEAGRHQLAAAQAQAQKAQVQLGYTEIHAPMAGIVDVRAALPGEVVNPGQAIFTLIDPDNLWVRVDVEEGYVDRIHLGKTVTVRLPSGAEREGTVFFRGIDAEYATQRDVSRTKRDIKTFEIRLRCDNRDRALAVGMTAYVTLPVASP
jgi:HlyD family secretion protein